MTDLENESGEPQSHKPEKKSPGRILLAAREAAGLALEQVAKELFMTVPKVQALEQDDFSQFNSPIFVRGYLRSYAKLLKINGDQVVAEFDSWIAEQLPQSSVDSVRNLPENPQKHLWKFILVIVLSLFTLYLISIWFFDKGVKPEVRTTAVSNSSLASTIDNLPITSEQQNLVATSSVSSDAVSSAATSVAIVAVTKVESSSAQNSARASSSAAVVVQAASSAASKKSGLDEISFNFREESWLEVSDSRGDVLATELQPAASHLSLTGRAPFDVKLGNAPGVDVQLNGKKIPVVPLLTTKVLVLKVAN